MLFPQALIGGTHGGCIVAGQTGAISVERRPPFLEPRIDIGKNGENAQWGPTILATLVAFGVGYLVIAWLMAYIKKRSFVPFVIYRVALGVGVIIVFGTDIR